VRVLIFHGYLLEGTGSNVYNARLAEALAGLGHEVHLLSQDRHAAQRSFVDAVGDWDGGELQLTELGRERPAGRGRCTVYRPDIGELLPVYVQDRYEGVQARTFARLSDEEVERYVRRNVAAVQEVARLADPEAALANHLVMGPVILARALGDGVPYAVKIHGSALEYTVKPERERFLPYAREGLAPARGILVGSRHTAISLWETLADETVAARTRLGPPGVDVERFSPRDRRRARAGLRELACGLAAGAGTVGGSDHAFARDPAATAQALGRLDPESDRLVVFVGKLIVSKGIDLLAAAWPLVLEREPRARLVVVGFGAFRKGLESLCAALAAGRIEEAEALAQRGRELERGAGLPAPAAAPAGTEGEAAQEAGEPQPLCHLLAFLRGLQGDARASYLKAARRLPERMVLTGRLEHEELAELLPACEAMVVPSTFPEAFGMVAAEAAACGVLPISAAHSGLAEVSEVLARALPPEIAPLLAFPVGDGSVPAIAQRIVGWLTAAEQPRAQARAGLVASAREHWSWAGVARGMLSAAHGQLTGLQVP
jgi:glycosyltransferase involved in cell wall biosynthesis